MAEATATGTIYDLGYQHYEGERLGRANAIRTLTFYSLRSAFGIGRGERAKLVPILVGLLAFAPAIAQIALANTDGDPTRISYAQHIQFTTFFLVLFAAAQAPELLVMDRQLGTLSLYISRAIRATDYALAKLLALTMAVLLFSLVPQVVLFIGALFVGGAPGQALAAHWKTLGPIVGTSATISVYLASVSLCLSAFTIRKGYASATVIAFFLMLPVVALMSTAFMSPHAARYAILGNPIETINGFARWAFGVTVRTRGMFRLTAAPLGVGYFYALAGTIAAAIAILWARYTRSDL